MQSSHNVWFGYGQPIAQSTHLVNQSPYLTNYLNFQNSAPQLEQKSTNRTVPSVVELLTQQKALQTDTIATICQQSD